MHRFVFVVFLQVSLPEVLELPVWTFLGHPLRK